MTRETGGAAPPLPSEDRVTAWWRTGVTRIAPGVVEHRGVPVQELIGAVSFVEMIWLMVRGERPSPEEAALLEAALVASTDHGPQAPSIAIARMAATCGVGLNSAMASGVNVLGDVHGGAGEQCMEVYSECLRLVDEEGADWQEAGVRAVAAAKQRSRYVPGFGHRFHPRDPRRDPLLHRVADAATAGTVPGRHLRAALAVEAALERPGRPPVPMNIDGATAVVYGELGFPPALARGLFVLSRSVGILAHAWEESGSGRRNKGPMPPTLLPPYDGPGATRSA
ncbi:citryl-CoA lyase [Aquipuribacter nitratireducens]|uniref:citrate synthase (unknown stereospecificity) n=1 Tax=Aquipuribacter nitratireducens TaxID=650104 RepID=A0ABW0GS92_9MICO